MLGRHPRLQRVPQPQRHVGVLGGVIGRLVDGDAVETDLRFAGAGDVMEMNGVVVEPALGEIVHAVAAFAGVEHVGDQHGVVVAGDLDAALGEHQPVVFHVLRDLEDALVLEQRLENGQRVLFLDLVGCEPGIEQPVAAAILLVRERHIAGFVGCDGEREAAQAGLHRVETGGLGIDRDHAEIVGARDPFLQARQRADAFVFAAVDFLLARGFRARGGKRDRGEGAVGFALGGGLCLRSGCKQIAGLPGRRGGRSGGRARYQFRVRLDLRGIDVGLFRDAAGNGVEFHRLEEGDQIFVVRLMHRELIDRHIERHVLVERDQPLGNTRDLGIVDQRLPALVLLDLAWRA